MGRASPMQGSFNAGEFSPRLDGRQDIAKYSSACKLLEGFIPLIQGPAQRRGGTRMVAEIKDSTARSWLVRFEFNTTQAYQVEFGNNYLRFYANHGQVVVSGAAAYNGATAYAVGDIAVQAGINYYCIAVTTGNPPPNATYWYAMPGQVYEIPSPYTTADLTDSDGMFRLRFVESADVMYIVSTGYAPRKLSRLGVSNFVLTTVLPSGGPFKDENVTSTTVYASALSGAVTLTASANIFAPGNVGSLFQLSQKSVLDVKSWEAGKAITLGALRHSDGKNYIALNAATTGGNKPTHSSGAVYDGDAGVQWQYQDPGFGCVLITGYTNATTVSGTVVSPFPSNPTSQLPANCVGSGNATARWNFAAWSSIEGWPTHVALFRARLCFGRKQRVWQSVAGDYETFTARDQNGLVTTDMAITIDLQSAKVNDMQWMEANSSSVDALVVGTAGSEFVVKSMTENSVYGTDNNTSVMISTLGSKNCQPVHVGNVLLFLQRAGSKLRDVSYDFYSNQFESVDQSVLAEHIPKIGMMQLAYQQEPYSLIWGIRSDGLLTCMTYSREQYPDAPHGGWHRHPIGGAGVVESISVIPAPDSSRDELWMIVRRTINGTTRRYVEYMEWERRPNDNPLDQFYVDAGQTLDNTALLITGNAGCTLTLGATALIDHAVGVLATAATAIFQASDVGREIHTSYSTADSEGVLTWFTAKAIVSNYTSPTQVVVTINAAFPSLVFAAAAWRLTVTTISGLGYLEGQVVDVLADGASHPQRTVSGGAISLQVGASRLQVGLPSPAKLQTMRLNAGAQDGTSQGKKTRVSQVTMRLLETGSLRYGIKFTDLFDMDLRTGSSPMNNAPPIFSGDVTVDWPGEYDTSPWLCFLVDQPLACTIVALMPQVSASDKG